MEHNYTAELSQANRTYHLGKLSLIKLFPNGLSLIRLIVFGSMLGTFLIIWAVGAFTANAAILTFYGKSWLYMIIVMGIVTWALVTLDLDNKNFFDFAWDKFKFQSKHHLSVEHGHVVLYPIGTKVVYQTIRRGKKWAKAPR
jgi:hypothetical protein